MVSSGESWLNIVLQQIVVRGSPESTPRKKNIFGRHQYGTLAVVVPTGPRRRLLDDRIRIDVFRSGFVTEGQLEFVGDLGPEFAQDIVTHVAQNAETYPSRGWHEAALVAGVIDVAQADRARSSRAIPKN